MWIVLFILALLGMLVLLVHVTLELNSLDKSVTGFRDSVRNHYGRKRSARAD
jgi:hypothetical protein